MGLPSKENNKASSSSTDADEAATAKLAAATATAAEKATQKELRSTQEKLDTATSTLHSYQYHCNRLLNQYMEIQWKGPLDHFRLRKFLEEFVAERSYSSYSSFSAGTGTGTAGAKMLLNDLVSLHQNMKKMTSDAAVAMMAPVWLLALLNKANAMFPLWFQAPLREERSTCDLNDIIANDFKLLTEYAGSSSMLASGGRSNGSNGGNCSSWTVWLMKRLTGSLSAEELEKQRDEIEKRQISMQTGDGSLGIASYCMRHMQRMDKLVENSSQYHTASWWPRYAQFVTNDLSYGKQPSRLDISKCSIGLSGSAPSVAGDLVTVDVQLRDQYNQAFCSSPMETLLMRLSDDQSCQMHFDQYAKKYSGSLQIRRAHVQHNIEVLLQQSGQRLSIDNIQPCRAGTVDLQKLSVKQIPPGDGVEAGSCFDVQMQLWDSFGNSIGDAIDATKCYLKTNDTCFGINTLPMTCAKGANSDGNGSFVFKATVAAKERSDGISGMHMMRYSVCLSPDGESIWSSPMISIVAKRKIAPETTPVVRAPVPAPVSLPQPVVSQRSSSRPPVKERQEGITVSQVKQQSNDSTTRAVPRESVAVSSSPSQPQRIENSTAYSPAITQPSKPIPAVSQHEEDDLLPSASEPLFKFPVSVSSSSSSAAASKQFNETSASAAPSAKVAEPKQRRKLFVSVLGQRPPTNLIGLIKQYSSNRDQEYEVEIEELCRIETQAAQKLHTLGAKILSTPECAAGNHLIIYIENPSNATNLKDTNERILKKIVDSCGAEHVVHFVVVDEEHYNLSIKHAAYWEAATPADQYSGVFLSSPYSCVRRIIYLVRSSNGSVAPAAATNPRNLSEFEHMIAAIADSL